MLARVLSLFYVVMSLVQRPVADYESRIAVRILYTLASLIEHFTGLQVPLRPLARKRVLLAVPLAACIYFIASITG